MALVLLPGPDKGGYYHELFLRGKPGLAYRIQRYKLKGTGTRKAASPESEPNLYSYPYLPGNAELEKKNMIGTARGGPPLSLQSIAPSLLNVPNNLQAGFQREVQQGLQNVRTPPIPIQPRPRAAPVLSCTPYRSLFSGSSELSGRNLLLASVAAGDSERANHIMAYANSTKCLFPLH